MRRRHFSGNEGIDIPHHDGHGGYRIGAGRRHGGGKSGNQDHQPRIAGKKLVANRKA